MLYQGAVRFIRLGIDAIERNDPKAAHTNLVRAQDIIVELLGSLNHEAGGQIAGQLASVYDYCFRRLVTANIKKDPAPPARWSASCGTSGPPGRRSPRSSARRRAQAGGRRRPCPSGQGRLMQPTLSPSLLVLALLPS